MLPEEAEWIQAQLARADLPEGGLVVDYGSSTEEFRRLAQPYIDYRVFLPLRRRGSEIFHVDARDGDGIDLRFDIAADGPLPSTLRERACLVLCCNLLEHVVERDRVVEKLAATLHPQGLVIVTVPRQYRYHPDPIDTMYRPSSGELAELFERFGFQVETAEELTVTCDYLEKPSRTASLLAWRTRRLYEHKIRGRRVPARTIGIVSAVVARRIN